MIGERHKTVMTFRLPVLRELEVDVVLELIDEGTWRIVEAEYSGGETIREDRLPLSQYLGEGPGNYDIRERIDAEGERLSAEAEKPKKPKKPPEWPAEEWRKT